MHGLLAMYNLGVFIEFCYLNVWLKTKQTIYHLKALLMRDTNGLPMLLGSQDDYKTTKYVLYKTNKQKQVRVVTLIAQMSGDLRFRPFSGDQKLPLLLRTDNPGVIS